MLRPDGVYKQREPRPGDVHPKLSLNHPMCYAVKCEKCSLTTWKGCGKHVEQVMKDVKAEERCKCSENADAGAAEEGTKAK